MTSLINANIQKLNDALLDIKQGDDKLIKLIVENIPEWARLLECKQHNIHDYTLDIHTLHVIKKIREFKTFGELKEFDRLVLLYAALLHDIEKKENEVDPEHPYRGAKKSGEILYKLGFTENFTNRVYLLINYHQILGLIGSGKVSFPFEELAAIYKDPLLLDLQTMLSIADIKSVKKNEAFFNEKMNKKIHEAVEGIKFFIKND
ncbi:MAG: hypothetical protein A2Y25_04690 [Candidatus Melainabacteria bacterium GWF2_37_15]|nr:MAG: hypothetical protein A2Y25_04690 [Candidatus Melainabacteria bacterium GWF2_37_15]